MPDLVTGTPPAEGGDVQAAPQEQAPAVTSPGETGQPAEAPAGTLPPDVHPAVKEAREKARRWREIAEQAFVFDEQGQVIGIRQEFAEGIRARFGETAAMPAPTGGADEDLEAKLDKVAQDFAMQYGLLPEQVKGIIRLMGAVVESHGRELTRPLYESSLEQMASSLVASGVVPAPVKPYLEKWTREALLANPRAAVTPQGRETIIRQALGDYAYNLLRRRAAAGPASPASRSPALLRPTPGSGQPAVPAEEQAIRQKLGLPPTYTEHTPREES